MTARRVQNQPAWLLHHRPFRDTSRILDVLSRDYGRLSLVARGSRSAKSKLKGVLRPFMPLQLSWVIRGDLGTLTGAEMDGGPISLNGDSLLSAFYLNELLLNLLHRHDPQPEIFSAYHATIIELNGQHSVATALRRFEMELLRLLGYALNLDHDTESGDELDPGRIYEYRVERGPVPANNPDGPLVFTGAELIAVAREDFSDASTLRDANRLLRHVIAWHLNGKELKSRKVLKELRRGAATADTGPVIQ
ncbi:MAG: DNA repair protein RecO [Proteobacteria bacterium]|nr:DNA repair protein RecO [Pseudomonadota bacterium]MDA0993419.1 DNA repair protein RecO [Pseudomonadota bacterium]